MPTNIALAFGPAQSNERGKRRISDEVGAEIGNGQSAKLGPPCTDPVYPNGTSTAPATGTNGSILPTIVEGLVAHGIHAWAYNTAFGSTNIIDDWCGDAGSGVPFTAAQIIAEDVGSDPNGYLASMKTYLDRGVMDKRVACISIGQGDASNDTSLANFQAGIEAATGYFLAQGYYVAIGLTVFQTSAETWFDTKGVPAVAAALATYADNDFVIQGVDATTELGKTLAYLDRTTHIADSAYPLWAAAWVERLKVLA